MTSQRQGDSEDRGKQSERDAETTKAAGSSDWRIWLDIRDLLCQWTRLHFPIYPDWRDNEEKVRGAG
jgi:hypothetical protein